MDTYSLGRIVGSLLCIVFAIGAVALVGKWVVKGVAGPSRGKRIVAWVVMGVLVLIVAGCLLIPAINSING